MPMPNGPKAIPNEKLRRFIKCPISNKETLVKFIECSEGEVPIRDEGLVFGLAIGCPEELWRLPMIPPLDLPHVSPTASKKEFSHFGEILAHGLQWAGQVAPHRSSGAKS